MRSIFLCGHTGGLNRGCEAIVRSTVKVLQEQSGNIFLATFDENNDRNMAEQTGIHLIPYASYASKYQRYLYGCIRKLKRKSVCGQGVIQKPLFEKLSTDDLCLNIGGDTYCYGRPVVSLALNKYTQKNGIRNILWCCSVEKDVIHGEILEDLLRYDLIFAREMLTYNALIEAGIPKEKVVKCCDPAFFLDMEEVPLPEGFCPGQTVGFNVSSLTVSEKNPHVYDNVLKTIGYILEHTNMSVCLIPHVYRVNPQRQDYALLKKIQKEIQSDRVCIVDKEYNCQQLKYIISQCRFFIGSRTHATIAAYSTGVPTLVLGYSVKSRGIAVDLFGTDEGYVLPYTQCTEKLELIDGFRMLMDKEQEIRQRLQEVLPSYRQQLLDGMDRHIKQPSEKITEVCNKHVCTGCGACAQQCAAGCITMQPDEEGFLYPHIDTEKCVQCGLCKKICPVLNKGELSAQILQCFSAVNKNEEIRKNSSSGGVFSAVAEQILNQDGVVFGAELDEEFTVIHSMACTHGELAKLRGSKYVQSNLKDTFRQARNALENGKVVLYTGTPCQIGGLKTFLGKEYPNLYTMDFICHGVASPMVWKKYLDEMVESANSKPTAISFRSKILSWRKFSLQITFENGAQYAAPVDKDPYLRGFVANLFLRPSCATCAYKGNQYQSDLTMADHWGADSSAENPNTTDGVSVLCVRTAKGEQLLQWIQNTVDYTPVQYEQVIKKNASAEKSVCHNRFRKVFFSKLPKKRVSVLVGKYCGTGLVSKIRRAVAKII